MPSEHVREKLIASAQTAFLQEGLKISARDVARKAGVNHGLVPYYFGNARGLLLAAVEARISQYTQHMAALQSTDAQNGAQHLLKWAFDTLARDPDHFACKRALLTAARHDPDIGEQVASLIDAERAAVLTYIRNHKTKQGTNRQDQALAEVLVAAFDGLALHIDAGAEIDRQNITTLLEGLLNG